MSNEIELISDGDGLAVIGEPNDVERFLTWLGESSQDLSASRVFRSSGSIATIASQIPQISKNASRWVQLTEKSAKDLAQFKLIPTGTPGISYAMIGKAGKIGKWVELVDKPSTLLNPAVLAGFGSIMAQRNLEKSLDEIKEFLEEIDAKLDHVIRTQANAQLSRVDAARFAVLEAMTVKDAVGNVPEVTWSKIQGSSTALLESESFALRQLRDEMRSIQTDVSISDLYTSIKSLDSKISIWLTVIADCALLLDEVALLELDRVATQAPEDLDKHRIGLRAARQMRIDLISKELRDLFAVANDVADRANSRVLYNPLESPKTIDVCNSVSMAIGGLSQALNLKGLSPQIEARRWRVAASEQIENARQIATDVASTVQSASKEATAATKSVKSKLVEKLGERKRRPADDE